MDIYFKKIMILLLNQRYIFKSNFYVYQLFMQNIPEFLKHDIFV
ncbi:hypothetical protein HNQ03_001924 [Chryseobacterium sp. 16F]|uniref:Uncharacterized protein n=1 Tax=Frigoriflavimonas asaccharolytica TaxID=2735899 RepID=A0A8J8G7Z7_9FLAO|nr:hypothetical protein [Frigoriflavimonas asaccharolytica]